MTGLGFGVGLWALTITTGLLIAARVRDLEKGGMTEE